VAVLNDLVPRATGEILVLTDTDTTFDHAALAALLAPLADPEIGAVTGRRRIGVPAPEQGGEGAYLAFESWLCARESAIHSTVGAWGSFYAVRRELFPRLPAGNLHDDQCAVLSVLLAGRRVVHVPAAVAWENAEAGLAQEFRRKVRFAARGFQTVAARPGILNPAAGFPFVAMLSHKILRWLAPLFWAALLVAAVALRRHGALFEATAWAFAAGAAAAALGGILERTGGPRVRLLRYAFFAAAMNAAFLWGTVRFLLGRESAKWDPSTGRMR
jgi:cellulose synthase/poly-beta-1,6-N-acetylglucosamine synthase-like glycosyltransferase